MFLLNFCFLIFFFFFFFLGGGGSAHMCAYNTIDIYIYVCVCIYIHIYVSYIVTGRLLYLDHWCAGEPEVETEISEEDKTIQDLMGFRNFNTTRVKMLLVASHFISAFCFRLFSSVTRKIKLTIWHTNFSVCLIVFTKVLMREKDRKEIMRLESYSAWMVVEYITLGLSVCVCVCVSMSCVCVHVRACVCVCVCVCSNHNYITGESFLKDLCTSLVTSFSDSQFYSTSSFAFSFAC